MSWLQIWMLLHILAAIVAFGPTFMFPLIVSVAGKEPVHMPFASPITVTITEKVTLPVALSMAVSGICLIVTPHIDFFGTAWLKLQTGGMILTAATLAVLVLMIWQPGGSSFS